MATNQLFDIYRNNVRTTAEMMRISLENAARLQEQQLGMVRNLLDQNAQSAERAAGSAVSRASQPERKERKSA